MLTSILASYGLIADQCNISPFGTGLINHTWKITDGPDEYILQRINQNVFRNPHAIADNMQALGRYLDAHFPEYLFVVPISTTTGEQLVQDESGYYRMTPFIKNSHTDVVVSTPGIACEAAKAFGSFTRTLAGFDANQLKITLPDFHNLTLRYHQFEQSLETGNQDRIEKAHEEINFLKDHHYIVKVYEQITGDKSFRKRVTHHDTKISNVLFDENDRGLCVIDLDTTMSGYFISDVGDMMRTYLCPLSEEEHDFSKLEVREDYFTAIARGYLQEMSEELSGTEIDHFVYAGEFMIFMQAVRFLTDHFNNDIYYGSRYEGHNFIRAKNQIVLLQRYLEKADHFKQQVLTLAASSIN